MEEQESVIVYNVTETTSTPAGLLVAPIPSLFCQGLAWINADRSAPRVVHIWRHVNHDCSGTLPGETKNDFFFSFTRDNIQKFFNSLHPNNPSTGVDSICYDCTNRGHNFEKVLPCFFGKFCFYFYKSHYWLNVDMCFRFNLKNKLGLKGFLSKNAARPWFAGLTGRAGRSIKAVRHSEKKGSFSQNERIKPLAAFVGTYYSSHHWNRLPVIFACYHFEMILIISLKWSLNTFSFLLFLCLFSDFE